MELHRLEVADVFWKHGRSYVTENGVSVDQRRVLRDVAICRTATLGGHVKRCDNCGHEKFFYKSCGNRHCPKCQGASRAKWLEDRVSDLLDTKYFHIVFTLPHEFGPIALQNKRIVYGILFRAASETLLKIARDSKQLGADIGFLAVLHTWGQRMDHHPHVHCVVPGGGLSLDGKKWISSRKNFFIHVKVLSRVFRGKFLDFLRQAYKQGKLRLEGKLKNLRDPGNFEAKLKAVRRSEWVVYAKPPFGGPKQVLKYLARYTHRVAISSQRLISLEDGKVTFRWKDYTHGNLQNEMTITAHEFIRRYLLHVLPKGFQRLRQYGFLANCVRKEKLQLCRKLLGEEKEPVLERSENITDVDINTIQEGDSEICPLCKGGRMVLSSEIMRDNLLIGSLFQPPWNDTS